MNCEHCTGTVIFEWFSFELVRCDWCCGEYHLNYIKNHMAYKLITFKDFSSALETKGGE